MERNDEEKSQMILVTMRMTVNPEKQDEFLQIIRWMLEPTRVEKGCMSYRCYQDIENENVFILVEEWKSRADLDRHIRSDDYRNLLSAMDLLSDPPEIKINTVSDTGGFEVIKEARGYKEDVRQ
jgi:quinol monooxygenase YgiN